MPVGLSPATAPTIRSKSIAISTSYPNLSTLNLPPKAAGAAAYLPNERRLISAGDSYHRRSAGLFTPLPPRFNTCV
jgi:hypothetical protein